MKEKITYVIAAVFSVIGIVLFFCSFSTGYYIFGEMNSYMVLLLLAMGIIVEVFSVFALTKWKGSFWTKLLDFVAIALLTAAAMLLLGDRVEGIGNCIVTDYDAGHGGEEAIYYSLAGSAAMLLGVTSNIIGCFFKEKTNQS